MKKAGILIGSVAALLAALFFMLTTPVDHTPFYETSYFRESSLLMDSLKRSVTGTTDSVKAGFAQVSITPGLNSPVDLPAEGKFRKVPLAGFGSRKGRGATGIHDSTFVKAVAVAVGRQRVIFVGADLLIMPPNLIDSVCLLLKKQGILREELVFSATHTHSGVGAWGPGFLGKQFAGEANTAIQSWLVRQIAEAVTSALNNLHPAQIGYGTFRAGAYTRNRLIGEKGIKNDDFGYLVLQQTGGRKAVIGSFSAHSTTLGAGNMEISGDYPGYWARRMEKTSVDLALFLAGSVGSQSPVGEGEGFEKPRYIGESLADSLREYLPHTSLSSQVQLTAVTLRLPLPAFHFRISSQRSLISAVGKKLMPEPQNPCLQAIRLGQMVWITTPADFSGEYAVQLKNNLAAKGFQANISSFNGSYLGYIIPDRYFYLKEYEPQTMGWYGPSMGEYTMDLIRQLTELATSH